MATAYVNGAVNLGEGPYTSAEFAQMLITAYQNDLEVRVPNFEIIFNNPRPSLGDSSTTTIPSSSSEYVPEVEAIIASLPEGYLCDIYIPDTLITNPVTNTANMINTMTYQNTATGWLLQAPVQSVIQTPGVAQSTE
jgi:hypothetical protein